MMFETLLDFYSIIINKPITLFVHFIVFYSCFFLSLQTTLTKFYFSFTAYADIALLETSRPIDFNGEVSPICIPSPEDVLEDDEICLAVGWGALCKCSFNT